MLQSILAKNRAATPLKSVDRQLWFETLERRQLLAGDVTALSVYEQDLTRQRLTFEANVGQAAPEFSMASRIADGAILIDRDGVTLKRGSAELRMELLDADVEATVTGGAQAESYTQYYLEDLRVTAPHYQAVTIEQPYPGIDTVYYGSPDHQLEFDFVVAPHADPNAIQLLFPAGELLLSEDGLTIDVGGERWRLASPLSYQIDPNSGEIRWVDSQFILNADNTVSFELGEYDPNLQLTIDPVFSTQMTTFLGGVGDESAQDLLVVGNDVYITGYTTSAQFTSASTVADQDAFLAKLDDQLTQIEWVSFFGGSSGDAAYGLDLDINGNIVIAGETASLDLQVLNALQPNLAGGTDAFFATFTPAGVLTQATHFGGVGNDLAEDVATGPNGEVYLAGLAMAGLPTQDALQSTPHGANAGFLAGFANHGQSVLFSTFVGGSASTDERARGVAVANSGAVTVVGTTADPTLPTTQPIKSTLTGASDAYMWQVAADGSQLLSGTYLGEGSADFAYDVAIDPANDDIVIAGQVGTGGDLDNGSAAAWRVNSTGNLLQWIQKWGGTATDSGRSAAVDDAGNAIIGGIAFDGSFGFTKIDPLDPAAEPVNNAALIAKIAPAGQLRFSSLVGGVGHDAGFAVGAGPLGMYLAGETNSASLATAGAAQTMHHGALDAYATLIVDARWQNLPLEMLGQLERYAVDTVRYFTSTESNNLLAGLTHSWLGQGPYQDCIDADDDGVFVCTEPEGDIARGFGSHVVMNEATLGFNVLMVALKMGWLDYMNTSQHYAATVGQVIKGLETIRGLQTSGDNDKFLNNTFYRSYITTPDGADNDLLPEQVTRDPAVNIRTSDDNGLTIHNLLILRGLADDPLVNAVDRQKIRDLVDAIVADIRLSEFVQDNAIAFELKWNGTDWAKSPEVWDREVGEGVQILSAMLLTREIDVATFETMAAKLLNVGPVDFIDTDRGDIRIETPGFHAAMFQHGLRAFHGFPVTSEEYVGATFFEDSVKPTAEYQIEFAREKGLASLGTQVMTANFNGHQLTRQAMNSGVLARFPGNEFKEEPMYDDTMSPATAAHGMVVPLARFREMNPSDIIQLLDWLEAYEEGFYRSGSDTKLGFQAEIPHWPEDTHFTWQSEQDLQRKYADGGVTYDALDSAYTVLSIFDAFNPDAPLSSYHAMAQRTGEVAAYLDSDAAIDADMFATPGVEILPATTVSVEEGKTQLYTVRLQSRPLADVVIELDGGDQLTTNVSSLTFTPDNWDQPQQVTVTAVDDFIVENLHFGAIAMTYISEDYYYDTFTPDGPWTVQIEDNEVAPTDITLDNQIIPEGLVGAEIANVAVVDADQLSGHTIELIDGRFILDNRVLRLAPGVSFSRATDPAIDLQLMATDASGFTFTKTFSLSVVGIALAGGQILENVNGATAGTLGLSIPVGPVAWTVSDGRFETDGNVLKLKSQEQLDYEDEAQVTLTVNAMAAGDSRLTFSNVFQVAVVDANDTPTDVNLDNMSVFENSVGAPVGSVTTTDEDANDSHTYSTSHTQFTFDGTLLKVKEGEWLTGAGTIVVPITTTDSQGAAFTKPINLSVLAHAFPWQNPQNAFDVTPDGVVNVGDLRIAFVHLTANGGGALPPLDDGLAPPPYWDVFGDNVFNLSDLRNLFAVVTDGGVGEGEAPLSTLASEDAQTLEPIIRRAMIERQFASHADWWMSLPLRSSANSSEERWESQVDWAFHQLEDESDNQLWSFERTFVIR